MAKFVDLHQHVAYGLDDGARNNRCSQRMLDISYRSGICVVIATPHVQPGKKVFDLEKYFDVIDELNRYCIDQNYDMRVLPGSEVMYTDATIRLLDAGYIPTLNHTRYVLVEWKNPINIIAFSQNIRDLTNAGYIPIVAHIERYRGLWFNVKHILQLKSLYDFRIQVDCDAIVGRTSVFERIFVDKLLKMQLVDYLATDAHNVSDRRATMKEAYSIVKRRYGKKYARQLTYYNQRKILGDE